ncbi:hypothetical protein ADUPG1_011507, partial [Aduncisulcus paluster]
MYYTTRDFRMMSRDEKRAQFRTRQFESDDLDGICSFTLQLARKADFHSVKYSGITGDVSSVSVPQDEPEKDRSEKHKRHTSDSGPHSFDSDFKMSRSYGNPIGTGSFGSSAGTTVTGRPVTQNLTTQRYPRTDPKPRCIYCGQANHWVWECTHRNAQIPRKQTYSDEWRRYSAILTQKGRTDVKRLFNAFWIECLEEGRASGIRPPQTTTGTSSEQNQSEQGV